MEKVLSIQSHVVQGYVGNRAAVFPMQSLGIDVNVMNTVQFSNHTGHGHWEGDVFSPEHIQALWQGVQAVEDIATYSGLLTGYMGSAQIAEVIVNIVKDLKVFEILL